ncbi:hypothetical protein P805_04431 [Serratia marcescens BIDMC 44]|nr:hypothetical protein P805_04431 [Serratia marcescens BIDMC 44]
MVLYIHSVAMVISKNGLKMLMFSTYLISVIRMTYQSHYMKNSRTLFPR